MLVDGKKSISSDFYHVGRVVMKRMVIAEAVIFPYVDPENYIRSGEGQTKEMPFS